MQLAPTGLMRRRRPFIKFLENLGRMRIAEDPSVWLSWNVINYGREMLLLRLPVVQDGAPGRGLNLIPLLVLTNSLIPARSLISSSCPSKRKKELFGPFFLVRPPSLHCPASLANSAQPIRQKFVRLAFRDDAIVRRRTTKFPATRYPPAQDLRA